MRGEGPLSTPLEPPPVELIGGVAQVVITTPFHVPIQYHVFMNNQGGQKNEYCDIFISHIHSP